MYPASPVMVAVAMTRYHQNRYITRRERSAESRLSPAPLWGMADAFRESGTTNKDISLELIQFSSSQCTSSCAGLARFLGFQSVSLMASGFVRDPGG